MLRFSGPGGSPCQQQDLRQSARCAALAGLWLMVSSPALAASAADRQECASNVNNPDRASPPATASSTTRAETPANRVDAFSNRGGARLASKDLQGALADYDAAIKLDPNYSRAFNGRGNVYVARTDYDRALADYNEAIKLDPKFAAAYYNRGIVHANKKDYARVIVESGEAIKLDPKHLNAQSNAASPISSKATTIARSWTTTRRSTSIPTFPGLCRSRSAVLGSRVSTIAASPTSARRSCSIRPMLMHGAMRPRAI